MIKITKPGLLTSVQDLGRYGYQKYGVITSGVMDTTAHRIANLLVGNDEKEATLELTLLGPDMEFSEDTLISICGGNLSPSINGKSVKLWRSVLVKAGSKLKFGGCKTGCRAYLAVAGGFDVPEVMNSKSTYIRAGIGGHNGKALQNDDELSVGELNELSRQISGVLAEEVKENSFAEMQWTISSDFIVSSVSKPNVRVMKGRQYEWFTKDSQMKLFTEHFEVTSQSDRMGYRLKGPELSLENEQEMLSEAVSFGTIQVPSEGNPIVLLADRQTTGGYPKIGQIATVDLSIMAQLKPGDKVQFVEVSHEVAQQLYLDREKKLHQLKQGIALKIRQKTK
ncbi:biotin-dependent carboxyltransferase family protein [Fictibacillus sp. b24]|uniref:5-oxoprolinase subunit C family protein n=1 Tax=Fictibacillus sp. b24 TaxID=3055863 RepID=UPI0025A245E6|nr:biotin-dependent carboxyltransferase family protein [Fictibacillus sp. b24]MDM5314987.1 biotin-dependent carboxyltransferase family protein [Fictibacillus sp. b24]